MSTGLKRWVSIVVLLCILISGTITAKAESLPESDDSNRSMAVSAGGYSKQLESILSTKSFGTYTKDYIRNILKRIEANYGRLASVEGVVASKAKYIEEFLDAVKRVDRIVLVSRNATSNDAMILKDNNAAGIAIKSMTKSGYKVDKIISYSSSNVELILRHEFAHAAHTIQKSEYLDYLPYIIAEGSADSTVILESTAEEYAKMYSVEHGYKPIDWYGAVLGYKSANNSAYAMEANLYSKLLYLVGAERLSEYKKNTNADYIRNIVNQKYGVDGKYGITYFDSVMANMYAMFMRRYDLPAIDYSQLESKLKSNKVSSDEKKQIEAKIALCKSANFIAATTSFTDIMIKLEQSIYRCVEKDIRAVSSKKEAYDMLDRYKFYAKYVEMDISGGYLKKQYCRDYLFDVNKTEELLINKVFQYIPKPSNDPYINKMVFKAFMELPDFDLDKCAVVIDKNVVQITDSNGVTYNFLMLVDGVAETASAMPYYGVNAA